MTHWHVIVNCLLILNDIINFILAPLRFCGQQTPEIDTDAPEPNQLRFELYFRQFNVSLSIHSDLT